MKNHEQKTVLSLKGAITDVGTSVHKFGSELFSFMEMLGETTDAVYEALRHPRKIRWRETLYYMNSCGLDGMPITVMICLLTGIILGYQCAVQMQKYGADAFLPGLVGCAMVRELGPLMTAIVATGRSGSAFAAEIATMKVSEELDAMVTMGFRPARFLYVPKFIALLTMLPLLTVIGDFMGVAGGFFVGYFDLGMPLQTYISGLHSWVAPKYFFEGIIKSGAFAWIIALIGCWRGFETGNDAIAVGKSTTSAVVLSILAIVIADAVMAKIFTMFYS